MQKPAPKIKVVWEHEADPDAEEFQMLLPPPAMSAPEPAPEAPQPRQPQLPHLGDQG